MRRTLLRALLPALATACLACAPPEYVRYERETREATAPSVHAVHSERLRALMGDIARLQRERLPQALDTRDETRRRAAEVARVARELADSATRIAGAVAEESLGPDERALFLDVARRLESRARDLARDAPGLPPAALEARVAAIEETCDACHARSRVPR